MKYVLFLNIKHPLILKTPPVFMIWGGSISQKGLYPLAHTVEGEHAYKPNQFQALYLTSDLPPKKKKNKGRARASEAPWIHPEVWVGPLNSEKSQKLNGGYFRNP